MRQPHGPWGRRQSASGESAPCSPEYPDLFGEGADSFCSCRVPAWTGDNTECTDSQNYMRRRMQAALHALREYIRPEWVEWVEPGAI